MIRNAVFALLFIAMAANAQAADWREVYHADFNTPGWETAWTFRGSAGPTDQGSLVTGGTKELIATLDKTFTAPAMRAEFDATFTDTGKGGEISDLSCFLDGVFFQVGGSNNARTRIRHAPLQSSEVASNLQLNKTVHITAEVNGLAARLSIDGQPVVSMLTQPKRDDGKFTFYNWTGTARFDNLRIFVKDEADPLPPQLVAAKERGYETPQTLKHLRDWTLPTVDEPKSSTVARQRVALHIDVGPLGRNTNWPITMGVPIPKGVLWNAEEARVIGDDGREIPSQRTVTATWTKGGSIRWLLLDFVLPAGEAPSKLFLEFGHQVKAAAVSDPVTVTRDDDAIEVTSGSLKVAFNRKDGAVLDGIYLDGRKIVDRSEAFYVTTKGDRYSTFGDDDELTVDVEMAGPIRTVIRSRGWYRNEKGERACAFTRRMYVYRGLPFVRLFTTWTVTVDTNAYKFTDVALRFPLTHNASQSDSRMHLASQRNAGVIFSGDAQQPTNELPDWITANGVTLSCYEMSRQWPAALETTASDITFHAYTNAAGRDLDMTIEGLKDVWGEEAFERFEANRKTYPSLKDRNANGCGIAKTHELILAFGDASATAGAMLQTPPIVSVDPAFACDTRVVGPGEYHPYDTENFAAEEAAILKRYEEFLAAIERLDPWYGWWDYGGGIPHYTSETSDGRVIYTGYRRTYDMGYQRPMVPWNFYLRSGQRAWLTYAIRNARCMMDMHTQHWTNAPLSKNVGWVVADNGTWPWDSYLISWTFNHYIPYLMLNYYTTGYERAHDVMIEVMDEYHRDVGVGGSLYCGRVGNWLGNNAAAYRATWDPRYLEVYRYLEQVQIEQQCGFCKGIKSSRQKDEDHDHGYTHRAGWREYGFEQALQVPEHDPKLEEAYLTWAKTLRANNFRAPMQLLNFAMLRLYRAEGNLLDARLGYESLQENASYDMVPKYGLAHLRTLPAAMKLALAPGVDKVALPRERELPGRVFVHHEQGGETTFTVDIGTSGPELVGQPIPITLADLNGNAMPAAWMQLDPVQGEVNVTIPAAHATSTWIVTDKGSEPLTILAVPGTPMMAAFPDGIQFDEAEPPTIWFNVPAVTRQFRVRTNLPERSLTIVRPDGEETAGNSEWTTVDVPTGLPPGPWAIRSGYENPHAFYLLKLYDIPAIVAFDRESVFDMANPPMPKPDFEGYASDAVFVDGAIGGGQALLLNGRDQLTLPLGQATGVNAHERFDAQRGTIEFFFKLNEHPAFTKGTGIPFVVPLAPDTDFKTWLRAVISFDYKNAFNIVERSGNTQRPIRLGPWNAQTGMLKLEPGRWYHVAVVWDADLSMQVNGKQMNKLMSKAFLNGEAALHADIAYPRDPNPHWLIDGFTVPQTADVIEMFSRGHNIVIDELRISRVPRATFVDKTYPVPTSPLSRDAGTLILMHFDGNTDFTGPNGETVSAPFTNTP